MTAYDLLPEAILDLVIEGRHAEAEALAALVDDADAVEELLAEVWDDDAPLDEFAEGKKAWRTYVNPETGQVGRISPGGLVRYSPEHHVVPTPPKTAPRRFKPDPSASRSGLVVGKAPPPSTGFPASTAGLTVVKHVGGSHSAVQVRDAHGNLFVRKPGGANTGHLESEAAADHLYKTVGLAAPESRIYETPKGPVKLSKWVEGVELGQWEKTATPEQKAQVHAEIRKGFAADALFGNTDVIGLTGDNIKVKPDGKVVRIDNGGALAYMPAGTLKGKWGNNVKEIDDMRTPHVNPQAARVFGSLTDEAVRGQIDDLLTKKDQILAAAPKDIRATLAGRIKFLSYFEPHTTEPAPIPAGAGAADLKNVHYFEADEDPTPKGFKKPRKNQNKPNEMLPKWSRPQLSLAEAEAVRKYTSEQHDEINRALHSRGVMSPGAEETHAQLQSAFEKVKPFETPVLVERGLKNNNSKKSFLPTLIATAQEHAASGRPMPMKGYQSYTAGGKPFHGPVLFKVQAIKGLDALPYSKATTEKEMILPHGTMLIVDEVEDADGRTVIHARQVL